MMLIMVSFECKCKFQGCCKITGEPITVTAKWGRLRSALSPPPPLFQDGHKNLEKTTFGGEEG